MKWVSPVSLCTLSRLGKITHSQEKLLSSSQIWLEEVLWILLGALINTVTEAWWEKREEEWARESFSDKKGRPTQHLRGDNLGGPVHATYVFLCVCGTSRVQKAIYHKPSVTDQSRLIEYIVFVKQTGVHTGVRMDISPFPTLFKHYNVNLVQGRKYSLTMFYMQI